MLPSIALIKTLQSALFNWIKSVFARSYTPMDKDLACDIHVVNLRTMLKTQYKLEPSENAALILHRQGFNSCYKPVGLTCNTNEGKVSWTYF